MLQYAFSSLAVTAEKPKLGLVVTVTAGVINMVGDALLVAPVWKQGEVVRSVTLPEGQWRCVSLGETEGDVLNGGRNVVLGENDGLVVLRRV